MAYWLFKCNPERYHLEERLAEANPILTWLVTRYRDEIQPGDTVFLWQTGADRGIRAVIRVEEAPHEMPELEPGQAYWSERDDEVQCRIVGTLTHRAVNLGHEYLRQVPGLSGLSVFNRNVNQQATNFEVTPEEGEILMALVEQERGEGRPQAGAVTDGIPDGITRDDVLQAIADFDTGVEHAFAPSTGYDLVYNGKRYPPKAILGLAARRLAGRTLTPYDFKGGEGSRCFRVLRSLGFEVSPKGDEPDPDNVVSLEELRRRALAAARPAGTSSGRESLTTYYERSATVRDYVLARAAGVCEACRRPAPFRRRDGTPYLEPHHTTRLADDGADHPRFVGAICANCHREIHHGENGTEINRRLQEYIRLVEPDDSA